MKKVNGDTGQEAHNKRPLPKAANQLVDVFKKQNFYKNKGCCPSTIIALRKR
jgi:hypothetical protein